MEGSGSGSGSGSGPGTGQISMPSQQEPHRKRPRQESNGQSRTPSATPSDESQKLIEDVTYNFIANEFLVSKTRSWTTVYDPATQDFITRVPESTSQEIQNAVAAATAAQPAWAALTAGKRRRMMLNVISLLKEKASNIKCCLSLEVGKTMADADSEFERGLDAIETACSIANELSGSHYLNQASETHTLNQPLGVCLTISPFNFPFLIPLWSITYAVLAGNTVILKPSERTPSASLFLAECFLRAGFPPGIMNVLQGGSGVVSKLLSDSAIQAVNFVGSEIAGERVHEHAKATRKRIQAECSGKNHGVVLGDASKKKTLYAIAGSAFGAAGQRCMALKVAVFVGSTKGWIDDLVAITKSLVVGSGLDPSVEIGPLISQASKKKVEDAITMAETEGAKVLLDGRNYRVRDCPDGNFVGPTILADVKSYMTCYQEEIFGPVLCCVQTDTLEEAIDLINNNRYGNGCTLFTSSPVNAQRFQRAVNVGQIGINVPLLAPSGPVMRTANKDSFFGDQNVYGRSPWQFYTMTKTVTSLWH